MKTITIVDTFAFFFRSYFALPPLKSDDGFPTGLLTGFINFIHQLQKDHATDYIVFALDSKGPTFREEIYPEYKANRPSPPEDLLKQLPIAIEWVEKMGFANLQKEGFEADDVIATIAKCGKEQGIEVKIVSSDKDLYQLIDDKKVYIYDWVKRNIIDEEGCIKKFGVLPKYFVDFQALIGDKSDNVPGVPGIGPKTASKLINEFHTLENLYANIERAGTPRIQKLLLEHKEEAFLSRELVRLRDDIFDRCELDTYTFEDKNYLSILAEDFKRYGMNQALKWSGEDNISTISDKSEEIDTVAMKQGKRFEAVLLDDFEKAKEIISSIGEDRVVAFDTETTGLDTSSDTIVGFSFAFESNKAYYLPVAHSYLGVGKQLSIDEAKELIEMLMAKRVVGQNLKFDLSLLYHNLGFDRVEPYADTMILAWLLEPGSKVGLDYLAKRFFNYEMKSFKDTVKKGEDFSSVSLEDATFYAAEDAWMTLRLYYKLYKIFKLSSLEHLLKEAQEVEYPFINVLISMESIGIKVSQTRLNELKNQMSAKISELTNEIYQLTGTEFNIKSTQQLGVVLFDTLGLDGAKKTKTGNYKTDEKVLNSLKDKHPVIEKILSYREYQKMLSTYVNPLLKLAKKDRDSRIHTHFLQTGTATGRLSSKDPNLQNIPVRTELGRSVRSAFIARDGYKLVSIDYSQIELRLLAHFSQDRALMEAFENDEDIHMATAIKLFGKEEAKAKRNFAKSINFGLLYGMGSRKLADELGITTKEAKSIIDSYFEAFPTVKSYLEQIQEQVKKEGFVTTLLGRRRVFDYEDAPPVQKASILRESVNTVFQGSAADLIKLSMLELDSLIREESLEAYMLLQIHDELIFEIAEDEAKNLADRFRYMMENIYRLNVPLKCSVSIGDSWDELK